MSTVSAAAPQRAPARLARLYLASRRIPVSLLVLVACAAALRIVLHWTPASGPYARQFPLIIEAAATALVGVTTRSPFGEPERATGRWLPFLRLAAVAALTGAVIAALAAGSAGAHLDGGLLSLARDTAGLAGVTLLTAALTGGGLCWLGTVGYLLLSLTGISIGWTAPWVWAARPPHDVGAAVWAALAFAAGAAVITVRGARDGAGD